VCSHSDCFTFFFFSSRRRHTRSKRDWSSDVCSSDLDRYERGVPVMELEDGLLPKEGRTKETGTCVNFLPDPEIFEVTRFSAAEEIGRASCRERVGVLGGVVGILEKRLVIREESLRE